MFVRKFEQWQSKMENLNEDLFSTLKQFIESNIIPINDNEKFRILNHLSSLKSQFENYFWDRDVDNFDLLTNPTEAE